MKIVSDTIIEKDAFGRITSVTVPQFEIRYDDFTTFSDVENYVHHLTTKPDEIFPDLPVSLIACRYPGKTHLELQGKLAYGDNFASFLNEFKSIKSGINIKRNKQFIEQGPGGNKPFTPGKNPWVFSLSYSVLSTSPSILSDLVYETASIDDIINFFHNIDKKTLNGKISVISDHGDTHFDHLDYDQEYIRQRITDSMVDGPYTIKIPIMDK